MSRQKQSTPPAHAPAAAPLTIPQFIAPLQPDLSFLDHHQQQALLLEHQHQLLALSLPQLAAAHQISAYLPTAASTISVQQPLYAPSAALQNASTSACSTLFVANLSPSVNEEELRGLFKAFPGFTRMRLHNKNGTCVAFVEYGDLRQATQAMLALQGVQLNSTADRGGLRIEYARNKMADVNG